MRISPPVLHRLTSVTYPGRATDTYTYDAVGNRLTRNSTTYTYGDAEQMLTAGGVSYQYDERGNQTDRGSDDFVWDHENRMTGLSIGSTTASYAYNGDGLRVSSTVGSNTTNYVWDVAAGLPVILQDGTNTYVYGLGLISTYDGTDMTYRLTDGLGSTVNLCDASGNVLVTYTYDVFGAIRSQTGSSGNYWKFTGEQRDSESGFDYLRARYYDPEVGRFLGEDPMAQGASLYAYALNNPANLVDPTGMVPAGVCLTNISGPPGGMLVGCTPEDDEVLSGDRWYNDYLADLFGDGKPPIISRIIGEGVGRYVVGFRVSEIDVVFSLTLHTYIDEDGNIGKVVAYARAGNRYINFIGLSWEVDESASYVEEIIQNAWFVQARFYTTGWNSGHAVEIYAGIKVGDDGYQCNFTYSATGPKANWIGVSDALSPIPCPETGG